MACFARLPNEILENIFQHLDFKNRKNLSPVCCRWNDVLLSERYLRQHVILHIEGCRLLDAKLAFSRKYLALSLKLDSQYYNEMMKNLRLISAICPQPLYLRVENWCQDQRLGWIFENIFFAYDSVEKLYLIGSCKTEKGYLCIPFTNLKVLKIDVSHIEYFKFSAPKLNELCLYIRSEEHMDLLPQFADQLVKLTVVFYSKDVYYFYNLKFPKLVELVVDRSLKGMTKSEQDISILFFKRLKQLKKLYLSMKFIDSYVMQMICGSISNLTELKLEVCEGTIELSNISKLLNLEKLKISAEKVNLLGAKFPKLKEFVLGSAECSNGTFVYAFEYLMLQDNMRILALHNVKFYPEVLKLTPTYNVERLYITHYKRLGENHLQILVKRFPAIRWLKIAQCPGFTVREVEKLKRLNPQLCVAFDEVSLGGRL